MILQAFVITPAAYSWSCNSSDKSLQSFSLQMFSLKSVLFRKLLRKWHIFLSSFQKKRGYSLRKPEMSYKVKSKQAPMKNILLERSNCYARSILAAIFGISTIFLCFKQRMRYILLACVQQEGFHASDRLWMNELIKENKTFYLCKMKINFITAMSYTAPSFSGKF